MPPIIIPENCIACGSCIESCEEYVFRMRDIAVVLDPNSCTDCRACEEACPVDPKAITF